MFACWFVRLFVFCPVLDLLVRLIDYLCVCLFVALFVCLEVCLDVCLFVR